MRKYFEIVLFLSITCLFSQTKYELWQQHSGHSDVPVGENDLGKFEDRKRSVLDKGNMVLRLSNAATYGYDRWGLNHEFPKGSIESDGCCTYYWTQSPIVGALINGQPSVAVGVRGSYRDSEEEFEPLPGYDAGYVDAIENIGIAFSDKPESWPSQWPSEVDESRTFYSEIYDFENNLDTIIAFPGIEPELVDGFPNAPCGYGIQADREAYFVVTDNDPHEGNTFESNGGTGPLNVRIDTHVLNYSSYLGNDGLFFIQVMTNVGNETLEDLYFGITGDPDSPEQGSAEWTDDLAMLIEPNDPHLTEKLAYTRPGDDTLLANLAIVWDPDDQSSGFISSNVAWIGLKFLECTHYDNDGNSTSYDVSSFTSFPYTDDATSDADAYHNQLASGIQEVDNITPHPSDLFNKPYSYGPDITWVIAAGPMDVEPGEQVVFTFADFMGVNESDLLNNARLMQQLYNAECKSPTPPAAPKLYAVAGDQTTYLYWDGTESEISIDPLTNMMDFEGYRIYRSTNEGMTWGADITNYDGTSSGIYKPLAIFDLANGISGPHPMDAMGQYVDYDLGNDSGLRYSYTDKNLINGYKYYYSVTAYDYSDETSPALENSKLVENDNTLIVTPQPTPSGFDKQMDKNHLSGYSDAELNVHETGQFIFSSEFNLDHYDGNFILLDTIYKENIHAEFEINGYSSCGEMFSDLNGNGEWDLNEPYEDLDMDGQRDEKIFDPIINKNFWGIDGIVTDSLGIDTIIVLDYEYDISSGNIKYILNDVIPNFSNGQWDIETVNAYSINNSNPLSNIQFGELGFSTHMVLSDTLISEISNTSCESGYDLPDCDGNCFGWSILQYIIGDGWCEDGQLGINLNCSEYNFDFGDCMVEPAFYAECPDQYVIPGQPSILNLRRDLELRFTGDDSYSQFLYFNGDGSISSMMANVPFELWTSINDVFNDSLDNNQLEILVLLNLNGTDTLGIESPLFINDETNGGYYSINRNFHLIPKYVLYDESNLDFDDEIHHFGNIRELIPFDQFSNYGWIFSLDSLSNWTGGEILKLEFTNPFIPGEDKYGFSIGPTDYEVESDKDLDNIRVVPNPFKITSVFQNNIEVKELQFHNLPDVAVIRIYNSAGELVKLIKHEEGSDGFLGPSIESWNLRTYNEQEIAFGVYLYHVQADGFEKTGKFAVIK